MKKFKKIASLLLALVMVCAMSVTAFAASEYVITVENSVTGNTYKAYKVFDATYSGTAVSYTITSSDDWYTLVSDTDSPFTLTLNTSGTYNVSLKEGQTDTSVAEWFNAITTIPGSAAANADGTGSAIELDVQSAGYYYITTETGSTVTVTTAKPTASVVDKNQTPGGDLDKTVSDTTAQIGDTVTYTITSNVPAYDVETQIKNYTFTDTLSTGLTAPAATAVNVTIKDASSNTVETGNAITVTVVNNVITVSYNPTEITDYPADATIEIKYTATVNADAAYENGNTVKQTWTGDSTGTTKTETVYTYGFNLKKYAESVAEGNELNGAEFTLTDSENDTIYFTVSDGTYTVVPSGTEGATSTISAGSVTIFGLDADETYTLTETKAPDGYNKLTNTVEIKVGQTDSDDNALYSTDTGINTSDTTVVNNAGSSLPGTGGIGTTIFYVVGTVMVLGAVVVLITRKRMSAQ